MEILITRKQYFDPYTGEFVYETLPSQSVKHCSVITANGTRWNQATHSIGAGTQGRMTYMHITTTSGTVGLILKDRYGTFDYINITRTLNHEYLVQGDAEKAPIHVVYGTFGFSKMASTHGTLAVAYEYVTVTGMIDRVGTRTPSR